jgi:type IV secretion system protein VirB1
MFGIELMTCPDLAVPREVMQHVVRVESSFNPYAIGVVGGRLVRQPRNLPEAVATARMLERRGYNFSLGLAQVNRYNLAKQGLASYEKAFQACPNLQAGSRILAECHGRSGGDWGRAFSCYYSGNFVTGYRHGYVQKVFASMRRAAPAAAAGETLAIEVVGTPRRRSATPAKRTPVPAIPPTSSANRVAARVVPIDPPAGTAARAEPVPRPAEAGLAVLDAHGGPPRLVGKGVNPNTPAEAPADPSPRREAVHPPPVDTAFVF